MTPLAENCQTFDTACIWRQRRTNGSGMPIGVEVAPRTGDRHAGALARRRRPQTEGPDCGSRLQRGLVRETLQQRVITPVIPTR